jgi:UDP-N-acetylmuramoylalanine--D-glutamate ligase
MFDLKSKNIVVLGMGVSGKSALNLLIKLGLSAVGRNTNDQDIRGIVEKADLIILSPGIAGEQVFEIGAKKDVEIWGEIELAYRYLESVKGLKPIIGITGTNGKTTTTTFLGELIAIAGKKVFVGGNIGIPFCDMAIETIEGKNNYDYILLELSSFQLESIERFHANIALILNIFQNHGERYLKIEDYAIAKFFINKNMTENDLIIYAKNFPLLLNWATKQKTRKISIDIDNPKINFKLDKFKLPGKHNLVNLEFVIRVAEELKLDSTLIQKSIDSFCGVHHRIEFVAACKKFTAYNDAKSTNWDATITAVSAMEKGDKQLYLIIGGKKRGHGDSILPSLEILKQNVDRFYLIGEMADEIEAEIKGIVDYKNLENLHATVTDIQKENFNGILLFSPGFPSFDQYLNYEKRGEHFVSLLT